MTTSDSRSLVLMATREEILNMIRFLLTLVARINGRKSCCGNVKRFPSPAVEKLIYKNKHHSPMTVIQKKNNVLSLGEIDTDDEQKEVHIFNSLEKFQND
jgi:hypothetical protein